MGAPPILTPNAAWDTNPIHSSVPVNRRKTDRGIIDAIGSDLRSSGDLPLLQSVVIEAAGKDASGDMKIEGDKESAKEAMETELRRLAVLKSYRVVGSGRNAAYERLVSLASRIFKAPISYITIIDLATSHILAARGLGAMADDEYERKSSISARTITSKKDHLVIPDLTKDEEFKDHKTVVGLPNLRFYAAAPLVCPEGYRLGSICVLDTVPRPGGFSLDMMQNLMEIAGMVMDVMVEERERMNFEYRQPSQMIACTSNDLKAPLAGIVKGLSSIRADKELLNSLSSQQKEIFNTAFACSSVMNRICDKSLESFNKDRRKKNSIGEETKEQDDESEKNLSINDLVKHLHVVMDPFPKKVPLVITTDDAVPPIIVADDLKIFRSVVNYLTNACAKTETGSVHLKIFLKGESEDVEGNTEPRQNVIFSVEDTGCGIGIEQYQTLFKPVVRHTEDEDTSCTLARLGGSHPESSKRTSLGLYSVATQISSIGGRYGFRPREFSETGSRLYDANGNELKGSVFWFSIPLVLPMDKKESPEKPDITIVRPKTGVENESDITDEQMSEERSFESTTQKRSYKALLGPTSAAHRQKRALIIEDSMITRRVMSRMLKKLGFDVVQSVNGMEGLKELQAKLFDIVFCDFLMPVMDGTDCVQQYREYEVSHRPWFDQYIVGMSAHANDADIERGMKVGMNDYREKPVKMKHIEEILEGQEYQYVTTRLDSIAAHLEEKEDENTKRQKSDLEESEKPPQHEQSEKVCLIVEEGAIISEIAKKVVEEIGWKSTVVHNGEAALRLLQMRNWDAVLLDEELSGVTSCKVIETFRAWERKNRVKRQNNVFQVNSSSIPLGLEASLSSTSIQLPSGFDGALGKPLCSKVLKDFLCGAAKGAATSLLL